MRVMVVNWSILYNNDEICVYRGIGTENYSAKVKLVNGISDPIRIENT